ncbi:hypothetical protein ACE1SV_39220 [Streptomyces sennicomposti]
MTAARTAGGTGRDRPFRQRWFARSDGREQAAQAVTAPCGGPAVPTAGDESPGTAKSSGTLARRSSGTLARRSSGTADGRPRGCLRVRGGTEPLPPAYTWAGDRAAHEPAPIAPVTARRQRCDRIKIE